VHDPIAMLKQDHREVAAMLKTLDASRPGARRRTTVAKLTTALDVHMRFEEAELYPLIAEKVGGEEAKEATIEHGLARTGVAQLNQLVDEPGFGAVVAMVTAGIRHHVKEEETELFPKLKKKLDRDALAALGDDYVAAKKRARTRPPSRV
jgi:hemerythrin-like domain-containing protein